MNGGGGREVVHVGLNNAKYCRRADGERETRIVGGSLRKVTHLLHD